MGIPGTLARIAFSLSRGEKQGHPIERLIVWTFDLASHSGPNGLRDLDAKEETALAVELCAKNLREVYGELAQIGEAEECQIAGTEGLCQSVKIESHALSGTCSGLFVPTGMQMWVFNFQVGVGEDALQQHQQLIRGIRLKSDSKPVHFEMRK
jgi:hypothetical protein